MLRPVLVTSMLVVIAISLAAQTPEGLRVRIDRSQNAQDPDDVRDVKVVTAGKGFRVTGGPAGTFWDPSHATRGDYTARATFTLMKPSGHTNYYGLVFGGDALEGAAQNYVYFLVAQDGTYLVRRREGDAVHDIRPNTKHSAIRQPGANGQSTNTLEVRVAGNAIAYVINGMVVHTTPKTGMTAKTDGLVGVRINHLLDVQVDAFEVNRS